MEFKVWHAIFAAVFCVLKITAGLEFSDNHRKLIVVLVDGVRWDYLSDPNLKGFRRIMENGAKAPFVIPIFPSLSYPNYYTIATGLYAEKHGFVDNIMYDPSTSSYFTMIPEPGSSDMYWWNEAEPIWITAEKNNRSSALYWWAGCEVLISGQNPTICERQRYGPPTDEEKIDYLLRIDDVVHMFKSSPNFPHGRLSLALFYYGSVDYEGHKGGPKSDSCNKALYEIDEILDQMLTKIENAGLQHEVNVMVVSDHGMTDVGPKTTEYISLDKFSPYIKKQVASGAVSTIIPEDGMLDKLFNEITAARIQGIRFYKRDDIPEMYHVKNNDRTTPLVLVASKGYYIKSLSDSRKRIGDAFRPKLGSHGFDPEEVEDMRTIFLATGPDFKEGFETDVLYNTDHYNLMCKLLGIPALPNNGSWDRVKSMIQTPSPMRVAAASASSFEDHYLCIVLITAFSIVLSSMIRKTL